MSLISVIGSIKRSAITEYHTFFCFLFLIDSVTIHPLHYATIVPWVVPMDFVVLEVPPLYSCKRVASNTQHSHSARAVRHTLVDAVSSPGSSPRIHPTKMQHTGWILVLIISPVPNSSPGDIGLLHSPLLIGA